MNSNHHKKPSEGYNDIIPVIQEWVRFTAFYYEVPGISFVIQVRDELLSKKAFGVKNLETKEQMTTETLFRIASHSKLFTATAIMELYAQGKLSLDDKVTKHLDWFTPSNDNIRIHHLLTHSSGITRDGEFGQWYHHNFPDLDQFKEILSHPFEILDPSVQIKYSNIAYTILGQIVEKVADVSYESYMKDLLHRLGLENTFSNLGGRENLHATGHYMRFPGEKRKTFNHVEAKVMDAATGFSSVPSDILQFFRAQMIGINRGLKYGDYFKREMQNIHFRTKEGLVDIEWGYGFWRKYFRKLLFIGHSGGYPGFITLSGFNPERELGISIFTNPLQPPLEEIFGGGVGLLRYAEKHYSEYDDDLKQDFTGYEGMYRGRWQILLIKQFNKQLIMIPITLLDPVQAIQRLQWSNDNTFIIREALPGASKGENVYFKSGEKGKEIHFGGDIYKEFKLDY